jgi:hypothetical protein
MRYNRWKSRLKSLDNKIQQAILKSAISILYHSDFDDLEDDLLPNIPLEFHPARVSNDRLAHEVNNLDQGHRE